MCGINGFNFKDEKLIKQMTGTLSHRGPDSVGSYVDESISLGHNRLAVIDLDSSANQPMTSEDGQLVIVYNGEIYNYLELKKRLQAGYKFKTQSDTEVILAGYRMWGKDVVKKLNGIFSFAIWDKDKKTLFCARDHMGVKPFYFYWDGKKFIFASEVKSILEHPIPREIDVDSLNEYLRVLYVPSPRTMLKMVYKLPPGHSIVLQGDNMIMEEYYRPQLQTGKISYKDSVRQVRKTVEDAVKRQLVADVPVGVYLSGGIDSSVILASVKKFRRNVDTFSVGFDLMDSEEATKFNYDFNLARKTAKHFGTTHHTITISAKDVAANLEDIVASIDDPISNPTALSMAFLSKYAKKKVTVVLAGDGGDELFGGYERYRISRRADVIKSIPGLKYIAPSKVKRVVNANALGRIKLFEFEKDEKISKVLSGAYFTSAATVAGEFERYVSGSGNTTEAFMLADLTSWLPDYALALGDKMSMWGSVEARVPLLDREVVNVAMTLPLSHKVTVTKTKKILKDAFKDVLPKKLIGQPKRGWFSPGAKWLRRKDIQVIARRALSAEYYVGTEELFDWKGLEEMLVNHISGKTYNLTLLWAVMTFQIWAKKYKVKL
jgi:asparagine synthase (glutamine-hydrolysing)